ncbi:GPN-loop GTPase 2 [Penicillium atrosanguineum]|nr:GPN-loop GTPase 2 [Penicillium atrosanguineum]
MACINSSGRLVANAPSSILTPPMTRPRTRLEEGLKELGEDYVLFDCPGQVELFTHHASLRNIFFRIQKLGYRVRHYPSPLTLRRTQLTKPTE